MPEPVDFLIRKRLERAQSIAIASHVRPDGDAVGSLIGLGTALLQCGKSVQMALADGVPEKYQDMVNSNLVTKSLEPGYDTLIVVDSSEVSRTGALLTEHGQPDICIDHHKTNDGFAKINLVEEQAVATAEILASHFPAWGLTISRDVASWLLIGMIADTIGFRTSNMNPGAMRLAADLMGKGADLPILYGKVLINRTLEEMRYWGQGLGKLTHDSGLIWTSLTLNDRITSGYSSNDDADLINILSAITEAKIALIFVEQEGGSVKVSWRAVPGIDVSVLAFKFGGGGHAAAAGADIKGNLTYVSQAVLTATKAYLDEILY